MTKTEKPILVEQILGTWRLDRATAHDPEGKPLKPPYGPIPMGRLIFNADGRMMAVVCDGRVEIPAQGPRAYASYCGNFTLRGDMLTTKVDAAARAERIGGEQIRRLEFRGGHLVLIPPCRASGEQRELFWSLDGPA